MHVEVVHWSAGLSAEIVASLDDSLQYPRSWSQTLDGMPLSAHGAKINEMIVLLGINISSNYDRRVHKLATAFPIKMLRMAKSNRDLVCPDRQAVAQEVIVLALPEINTKKLRRACLPDFKLAARTGRLGPMLFSILSALATQLNGDIQNLEGVNSIIKTIGNRCTHISLALMSSRVQLKYQHGAVRRVTTKDRLPNDSKQRSS